jgi:hypothetical protein
VGLRAWWAGVVAALTLAAAGVTVAPAPAGAQATPALRVSMYGDSVMLGARDQLLAHFAGMQVTVDAVEDRSLLGTVPLLRAAGPALGDVVVLDLGYNDSPDPAVFRGRIDDAMSVLAGVKRVIWLDQHDWGGRAGMNAELVAAASRYPNLDVVDWNAEVAAHPEDVYGDSIHLTPAGQAAMAALVRDHVDRYVTSLTPTTTAAPATTATTAVPATSAAGARSNATVHRTSPSDSDPAISTRELALLGVLVLLLVAGSVAAFSGRRSRRRPQRRAVRSSSSSARSASGSVRGSRQANRSHT